MVTAPTPRSAAKRRKRFVYGSAAAVAALFMIALVIVQLEINGARGLRDGEFIGVDLAVGIIAFRSGLIIASGYERLTRQVRARKRGDRVD
jgi:hypothetical protein